jgi:drug/metabolite transporter (DMT)-like permease
MVTILGLASALAYGFADFLGGAASRRMSVLTVVLLAVPAGLALLVVAAVITGGSPTVHGTVWGIASGLAGSTGLLTFYRALAKGPMSVVAPVSALAAAVLPVTAGTLRGERLDATVLAGVVLCLVAIGLVSMEAASPEAGAVTRRRLTDSGPLMAGVSGAAFGVFFILLKEAGDGSGLWPLVAARTGGLWVTLITWLVVGRRGPASLSRASTMILVLLSGALDAGANILYFLAAQKGLLSLAAVLTSLYPAVTVLLARAVYSERLRTVQRAGLVVALAGVSLVTIG